MPNNEDAEHVIANAIFGAFRTGLAESDGMAEDLLTPQVCVHIARAVLLDLKASRLKIVSDDEI